MHLRTYGSFKSANHKNDWVRNSNGKSSIVEERLHSFFFAFKIKNEASFFRFFSFTQLGTKTVVLLRSCKIFKRSTSLCFVFPNFWNNPIRFTFDFLKKSWANSLRFTLFFQNFGTTWSFFLRSSEV